MLWLSLVITAVCPGVLSLAQAVIGGDLQDHHGTECAYYCPNILCRLWTYKHNRLRQKVGNLTD